MKTTFAMRPHTIIKDESVIELWWQGVLIGTITGTDGPGIKIQSKYRRHVIWEDTFQTEIALGEITITKEETEDTTTVTKEVKI